MNPLHLTSSRVRWLRPVRPGDMEELQRLAREDRHELIAPSHVFVKDGELVGCASLAQIPLVLPWFHTTKCKAADSLYMINQMENLMANLMPPGQDLVCVPCVKDSPFQPHMKRLGYVDAGTVNITFKKVR